MEHFPHHLYPKSTPTPASFQEAVGFEQSMFGNRDSSALDVPSKIWITIAVVYTFVVCTGMMLLYFQRYTHAVRIRGFWLTAAAVSSLHIYLTLVFLVYPLRFWYGCRSEFWVTTTLFPIGIGLYQISNARLIFYYQTQQELLMRPLFNTRCKVPVWYRHPLAFMKRFNKMDFLRNTCAFVVCTWVFTILSSSFMFFGSFNFHEHYGLFGEWSGEIDCQRGPHGEWVPTVISQLLMCWLWGPYMLWHAKNIRDTHYWSLQTKINLIAGLFGTPLWITFLRSNDPGILAISRWFPHAGWFIPGLVTIQMGSIVFPILDVEKNSICIMNLRERLRLGDRSSSLENDAIRGNDKEFYSMAAFEEALDRNVDPLLTWTAKHNYTAAEINFLVYVRNWKNNWAGPGRLNRMLTPADSRSRYEDAAIIFFTFINPVTSRMTVNVDSRIYKEIAKYFDDVIAHELPGDGCNFFSEQEQVTPWEKNETASRSQNMEAFDKNNLRYLCGSDDDEDCEKIPKGFSLSVFDRAFQTIKEDIFYNTWLRYVSDVETHSVTTGRSEHNDSPSRMHDIWAPSSLQPAAAHTRPSPP